MIKRIRATILIALTLSTFTVAGCGGGGADSGIADAAVITATTAAIDSLHSSENTNYIADAQAIRRQLAAQGLLHSGNEVIAISNLYIRHVQHFTNAALTYASGRPQAERSAIAQSLAKYQVDDKLYGDEQLTQLGGLSGSALDNFLTTFNATIDSVYISALQKL